jgi:23S rRNA pseudouridine1911/1915/1917 synthase
MQALNQASILYEDNHLIAVDKRAGQTVQPEPGKPASVEEDIKAYIKEKYNKPGNVFVGVIHRLDMPVSGVVLLAKTSKALERMNKIFEKREVVKVYIALVEGMPALSHDTITHWLRRDDVRKMVKAFSTQVTGAYKAVLSYKIVQQKGKHTLLEIQLHTGRKHQIRAQLSAIGCPIVGDVKYAAAVPDKNGRIFLHAAKLTFTHPITNLQVTIESKHPFTK